jgi:hypothetical protein
MDFLDGIFKILWFMVYVAPFICVGIGIVIGWWIWG